MKIFNSSSLQKILIFSGLLVPCMSTHLTYAGNAYKTALESTDIWGIISSNLGTHDLTSMSLVRRDWKTATGKAIDRNGIILETPTDYDLTLLAQSHPHLRALEIEDTFNLTEIGFQALSHLKNLKKLKIKNPSERRLIETLPSLVNLQSLELIQTWHYNIDGRQPHALIQSLTGLKKLERLVIRDGETYFNDENLKILTEELPQLQELNIQINGRDREIFTLSLLSNLRHLTLERRYSYEPLTCEAFRHFEHLTQLQTLKFIFFDSILGNQCLQHISHLNSLKELSFKTEVATDVGIRSLSSLENLEKLKISAPSISGEGLQGFRRLKDLTLSRHSVSFNSLFTDQGIEAALSNPHLESFQFMGATLTDQGFRKLSELKGLKILKLSNVDGITSETAKRLSQLEQLEDLYFNPTPIDPHTLLNSIKNLKHLKRIYMHDNNYGSPAVSLDMMELTALRNQLSKKRKQLEDSSSNAEMQDILESTKRMRLGD